MNEPERLYLDTEVVHPAGRRKISIYRTSDTDIEYTRTDAFIEKACKYLKPEVMIMLCGDKIDTDKFIEDFKNYMKGE